MVNDKWLMVNDRRLLFAPGCGLVLYKSELVDKLHCLLNKYLGKIEQLMICCKHNPQITEETVIINICPGCDRRFRNDYANVSTVSLWELLAEIDNFDFPDYKGAKMTINDACPTRQQDQIHAAIRVLINKMNIELVEPTKTKTQGVCCGDSFYGTLSTEKVMELMQKRASEMPVNDVVVYCVSCINSMYIGKKKPRYLIDLLFDEETQPKTFHPDLWHKELNEYIAKH